MINVLIYIYIVTIIICIIALILFEIREIITIKKKIKIRYLLAPLLVSVIPVLNIIIIFTALEYVLLSKEKFILKINELRNK